MQQTTISFEFFPPKNATGEVRLSKALQQLTALNPEFITMTSGAGGSGHDNAFDTLTNIQANYPHLSTAAHITFITETKDSIRQTADHLWQNNIRALVALRGDIPPNEDINTYIDENHYRYTNEFITGLKELHDFDIMVGTYPEKHPDSPDLSQDLMALKRKQDAGASRALTQFFFDNSVYYDFIEHAEKSGITIPICPGILPVRNYERLLNFAKNCQATIPSNIIDGFEKYKSAPDDQRRFAEEILNAQVSDLMHNKVPHIHFYALNSAEMLDESLFKNVSD
ncbi:MAG: methylenetetrahydrofolate reductase [Pseudomonadota bacterium]|nr:methylenetetrahydrofolate reductase [Pseudomonadota bacterium]MEC9235759.1 methylenetetrahydrofolate reductase [Pseudomonadota bacterium]